jgi:hypothetical protein
MVGMSCVEKVVMGNNVGIDHNVVKSNNVDVDHNVVESNFASLSCST